MPDTFRYTVFISYSSKDFALAVKLEDDLRQAGVNVWRDQTRLSPGEPWAPQIVKDLEASQHLVLLWSQNAAGSYPVTMEWLRFQILIDPKGDGKLVPNRRLTAICTDADLPDQLKSIHHFNALRRTGTDFSKPEAATAWQQIVASLADMVLDRNDHVNVPVVTFAMTDAILKRQPHPVEVPSVVPGSVDEFLTQLGIGSVAALRTRYGATPYDWQPFGDGRTIRAILDGMLNDRTWGINARISELAGPRPVRWAWLDLMNAPWEQFAQEVRRLRNEALLVVVDPVSLCNSTIAERFRQIDSWLQNSEAAVIIMPPFQPAPAVGPLHEWLKVRAAPLLDFYYDPPPRHPSYTGHVVGATDEGDILRVVKRAVCGSKRIVPPRAAGANAITAP